MQQSKRVGCESVLSLSPTRFLVSDACETPEIQPPEVREETLLLVTLVWLVHALARERR